MVAVAAAGFAAGGINAVALAVFSSDFNRGDSFQNEPDHLEGHVEEAYYAFDLAAYYPVLVFAGVWVAVWVSLALIFAGRKAKDAMFTSPFCPLTSVCAPGILTPVARRSPGSRASGGPSACRGSTAGARPWPGRAATRAPGGPASLAR